MSKKTKEEWRIKMEYPTDEEWNKYVNIDEKGRKKKFKNNIRECSKVAADKQTWDSVDKLTTKWVNSPFDPIPEREVRVFVQQIREWVNRKVAVKAMWRWETRWEYFIDRWLKYTDKVMDGDKIIEKVTYAKDEILKAEAEQEKIARLSIMQAMKKWNAKVAVEFLNNQQKEVQEFFNDKEEYRQMAKDMWMTQQEYYWCLNVLNWVSERKASENVGFHKSLNMYHYRMNPAVKEFIKLIKIQRRQELMDWISFTKETAQAAMTYALWILMDEFQKNDNTKQDKINIAKEIRNTAESMWKATNLFPKEEQSNPINIAVLAAENTDKVLEMIGEKHNTKALNITQFINADSKDWWTWEKTSVHWSTTTGDTWSTKNPM